MRVVIVGGGSSGWITAATLVAGLNRGGRRAIDLTLIESPDVPRIGVGEATIPTLRGLLRGLGIAEADFLRSCDATFKQAIVFDNWAAPGHRYVHPFQREQGPEADAAAGAWLRSDGRTPFADLVSPQAALAAAGRGPRRAEDPDYGGGLAYAYHLDADLFAERLAVRAAEGGAQRVSAHVEAVEQGEDGRILAVRTADGRRFAGDLFIDCTGFRRLLIGRLDPGYVDRSDNLLCDSAVVMRVPYETWRPPAIRPYTHTVALEAGWAWDIGLVNRRGRGYVYASAFLDADAAEARLRAMEGPHAAGLPARRLRFEVGNLRAPWRANCVAIGLSAGFVEPLESTGLYLSEFGARMLLEYFPLAENRPGLAWMYNRTLNQTYDEIVDFVTLHYVLSARRDTPFWRAATEPSRRSERLAACLDLWEAKPPSVLDFTSAHQLFSHQSYEFILYGMGWRPGVLATVREPLSPSAARAARLRSMAASLPDHEALIAHLRAAS